MDKMTDSKAADVLRWLDAQAGDPDANERFRELRDYIARLREPAGVGARLDELLWRAEQTGSVVVSVEDMRALAQQPAAVDGAMVERCTDVAIASSTQRYRGESARDSWRRLVRDVLTAALATQHQRPKS